MRLLLVSVSAISPDREPVGENAVELRGAALVQMAAL